MHLGDYYQNNNNNNSNKLSTRSVRGSTNYGNYVVAF